MPIYPHKCKACNCKFDHVCRVRDRNAIVHCKVCGQETKRLIATRVGFTPFRAGMYPVGENDSLTYVGDRKQLKEACDRRGLISHYLEGSPSTHKRKRPEPSKWTEKEEKDLGELAEAVSGAGKKAPERASKWLKEKQRWNRT